MEHVLRYFRDICSIPHCSGETKKLQTFLVETLENEGCCVTTDAYGNIHAIKGTPSLCLQAHYDMVCLSQGAKIEVVTNEGWMSAVDSTLGADNGIGVAMILRLSQQEENFEALLTNDEEIGLIGANGCAFPLVSKKLLNLDSEELGAVFVGCAGGVDVHATGVFPQTTIAGEGYEIMTHGLQGGHSGVDIDKNILNALSLSISEVAKHGGLIARINGGERINSIPVNATIIAVFETPVSFSSPFVTARPLGHVTYECFSIQMTQFLDALPTGVLNFDEKLGIPLTSKNFALAASQGKELTVSYSLRSMRQKELDEEMQRVVSMLEHNGFDCTKEGKYLPWEIEDNEFINDVCDVYKKHCSSVEKKGIHAGLECASLKRTYPHIIMASIGPTILFPHSKREKVSIESIKICFDVVSEIVKKG